MSDARQRPSRGRPASPDDTDGAQPLFGSAMAQAARRTVSHFEGRNPAEPAGPPDAIEVWGRRIGRALSLAVCIGLGVYLYLTYLR